MSKNFPLIIALSLGVWAACGDDDPTEPRQAELVVSNQTPVAADVVTIDRVYAEEAGYVVVVQSVNDEASPAPIGVRAVDQGESLDLEVALERAVVDGEELYARLHVESNGNGSLDWIPGGTIDPIVEIDGNDLAVPFMVATDAALQAGILIDDQPVETIGGDEQFTVKSVVTSTAGFVVIQSQVTTATAAATPFGSAVVEVGLNAMVSVTITATTSPASDEELEALLYGDDDDDGAFDDTIDQPLLLDGEPIRATFIVAPTTEP